MSSSDPPQLRLSLPQPASNFKRSFEQFGFDLESPLDSSAAASSSLADEHRPGPSNTDRNKRARSSSITLNSVEQAHVVDSSPGSSSSHTVPSGSSHHPVVNHSDAPPLAAATRYPQAPETIPAFPSALGGELSHSSSRLFDSPPLEASPVQPTTTSVWPNPLSSTNSGTEQNDQFRISMERFRTFDSQISSIRSRPSPLPPRAPLNSSPLPPLTLSSPIEHAHSHTSSAVSLPSVESLSYSSTPAQASASAPPPTAPPSATSPDQYHSDMSPLRFEEFGEFREMMGFFQEQNPNSPSIGRPAFRRRHLSPPPDNSERPRVGPPLRRSTPRHMEENVSRNAAMHLWPPLRRGSLPDDHDDSDDEFGGRLNVQDRGSLDHPRSRLDSSLLASRIRRSMDDREIHTPLSRMPPPPFSSTASSQGGPNSTQPVNSSRTQEPGRPNRHELWPFHSPRLPVFAEAVRTLLGRARQRTTYASERHTGRSRSPESGVFSSSVSPAHYDWSFDYPEFSSSEDSPYELDLPTPSRWSSEENAIPTSRIQRDTSISRQVPWRSSLPSNEATQSDPVWRRPYHYTPHPSSIRTGGGRGDGANDTPLTRAPHATEPNTITTEAGPGWWRGVPRTELNYGLVHEHGISSTSNPSAILSDGPPIDHPSIAMRDFIWPSQHPQPPSHVASHDLSTRRPSEAYQSVQPPEVGGMMAVDADVFRPDESSEVPFSRHAAALFSSRAPPSTLESTSHRRPDAIGVDGVNELPYHPWTSRLEEDFILSASRRRANAGQRRHRASPEPERSNATRRSAAAEPFTNSTGPARVLDIDEFEHGPFRATLERLERQVRQGRQDQQMMERQAEMDRLRSRLDELQSQERLIPPSRAPTLPPLRLDPGLFAPEFPHRQSSPTPPANIETPPSYRVDPDAERRRRSWQRPRATRPLPHSGDSAAHTLPEGQNAIPIPERERERERERRRRPGTLELWSPVDAEDAIFSMSTPTSDSGFLTRGLARVRGEFQSTDGQQPRRESRGNAPWGMDPGRLASREPPADALRLSGPLVWTTHAPGSWEGEIRSEVHPAGSSTGPPVDTPVRGRRRRVNQSALPPQGRNVSEDERPVGARRASSSSRYAAARRAIRDPVLDRVQRVIRGGPREGGLSGRYARRNAGDYVRDEDFDASYENLLSLAATIGEVRPRHTPDHIINSLPSATFKEWRNAESDQRCPICLDDYQEDDLVMRLSECPHWLHKGCLQQWLRGATTCPVCRQRVRWPQPTRRERGIRAGSQPGPSRAADRSTLDIAREIHEHVRMVLPDYGYAAAIIHTDIAATGSGSEVGREIAPQDRDVDMSLDWDIAGPI